MPPELKIYECEVKKLFKKDGINEWRWVVRPVKDAISDGVKSSDARLVMER